VPDLEKDGEDAACLRPGSRSAQDIEHVGVDVGARHESVLGVDAVTSQRFNSFIILVDLKTNKRKKHNDMQAYLLG
jgi:hypothetical protein